MKPTVSLLTLLILLVGSSVSIAQDAEMDLPKTLLQNVNVWDGTSDALNNGVDVLIEGNLVKQIGAGLSTEGVQVIDGGGRTLMPGLIDMHSHLCIMNGMLEGRDAYDQMAMGAMTGSALRSYLD